MRSFRSYLGHKRNMVYVAEGPMLRLNQLACFFSVKEGQALLSLLVAYDQKGTKELRPIAFGGQRSVFVLSLT